MKKTMVLMLALSFLLLGYGVSAQAVLLWDQQPDPNVPALIDQTFPDDPAGNTYIVSDVTFTTDVIIESVTTYFTNSNDLWPTGLYGATLNIFDYGALGDPSASPVVGANFSIGANGIEVVASGLGMSLSAGTYWVGLTPELEFITFLQEFHQMATSFEGDPSLGINQTDYFLWGSTDWIPIGFATGYGDWDAAITIEGTQVPIPSTILLLGFGIAGLAGTTKKKFKK